MNSIDMHVQQFQYYFIVTLNLTYLVNIPLIISYS